MATIVERHRESKTEQDRGFTLTMTRVIKAPRERVFAAWTRPEMIRQWFGPETREVMDVKAEGHVGGAYSITMGPDRTLKKVDEDCLTDPGAAIAVRGEYVEVSPYDRVSFTWRADWAPGEESLVTISLRDVVEGTELKLEHTRFSTEQSKTGHENGWGRGLEKLAKLLEG